MTKYTILVSEPCSEDWNSMIAVEKGRFCAVCEKTVVDFSLYTKDELIRYIKKEGKLCGRVPSKYIETELIDPISSKGVKLNGIIATAINLLVLTTATSMSGQDKNKTEQMADREEFDHIPQEKHFKRLVVGSVVDEEGLPLPGASVILVGRACGVGTDLNGAFTLEVPRELERVKLVFQFIGMEDCYVEITNFEEPLNIVMKDNLVMEESVITMGLIIVKKKKRWLFF